jgi:transposase
MEPIIKCSTGLDVHKEIVAVTLLKELENGEINNIVKEFSTYPEDLKQLAKWLLSEGVELAVMESTGVFWKSVYNALEVEGVRTHVVNAKHVKQVARS